MSEYLSEEEQLEKLKSWWTENGTSLLVGIVLVVGGVLGWRWYQSSSQANAEAASDLYESYLAAEAEEAEQLLLFEELENTASGSTYHAFALLRQAGIEIKDGNLELARDQLTEVVEKADEELIRDVARLRLAGVLQGLDLSQDALATLGQVRGSGFERLVLETKGDIHLALGERDEAIAAFEAAIAAAEEDSAPMVEAKLVMAQGLALAATDAGATEEAPGDPLTDPVDVPPEVPAEVRAGVSGEMNEAPVEESESEQPESESSDE